MWIQISSGRGPAECEKAAGLFFKWLLEKLSANRMTAEVISSVPGDHPGDLQSVLIQIEDRASVLIEPYQGTVRWICPSPYRPGHKRKNWFISVEVYEEPDPVMENLQEIRIETMRSGGAGGQHVNKTESAVRITHLPTGLTVTAREERSQYLNRKLALARLQTLLNDRKSGDEKKRADILHSQHESLVRGDESAVFRGLQFREE